MPDITSIAVVRGRARADELGTALASATEDLAVPGLLSTGGTRVYLPVYRSAAQQAGGQDAFGTRIDDDGVLHVTLEAAPPEALRAQAGGANPVLDGTTFALVIDASGGGPRFALDCSRQGNQVRLSARFAGDELRRVRAALFDATPNVAVHVTQAVQIAVPQSDGFIQRNWSNDVIRQGLLDQFGGIPIDTAATYIELANGGDAQFRKQYLVLRAAYAASVSVPPLAGYVQWQVNWNGRAHNYYQDNRERQRVFYLPDRFELARGPDGAPTVSLLQFSMPADGAAVADTRALFRIFGGAVTDPARIADAARVLRGQIGATPEMTSLQDGHGVEKTFTLVLPNAQATDAGSWTPRPQAHIDLADGLRDELDLGFAQFRALWAAIFSTAPEKTLFRGRVDVSLADGRYKDQIAFDGRLPAGIQSSFFDDILDTSTRSTYPVNFQVRTLPKAFEGPPEVLQIGLSFQGAKPVTLEPGNMAAQVRVERSIRDIVLGNQAPDQQPYRLRVVRADGTMACSQLTADSSDPDLWVLPPMVQQCTGPCP